LFYNATVSKDHILHNFNELPDWSFIKFVLWLYWNKAGHVTKQKIKAAETFVTNFLFSKSTDNVHFTIV